jgi:hypothetical protein
MRSYPSAFLFLTLLGSCSFVQDYEVKQWNGRLSAPLSLAGDVTLEGSSSSVDSDFNEESYAITLEAENEDGWAPYFGYGRGSWKFDWAQEIDFERFTAGSRYYMEDIGDEDSFLFANTRPYFNGGVSYYMPDGFFAGADRHTMDSAYSLQLGAGLQRFFKEDLFVELGAQLTFGSADENIRNEVTTATANVDWEWDDITLLFGIGKRF